MILDWIVIIIVEFARRQELTENEEQKQQQQKASHYLSAKQKFPLVWDSCINFIKWFLVINFWNTHLDRPLMWIVTLITVYRHGLWFCLKAFENCTRFNGWWLKEWFKVSLGVHVYCFVFTRDFAWSPSDDVIAFWVPENKDTPARVTLMEIPSRKEIRVKNLFNVSEVKFSYFIFIIIIFLTLLLLSLLFLLLLFMTFAVKISTYGDLVRNASFLKEKNIFASLGTVNLCVK